MAPSWALLAETGTPAVWLQPLSPPPPQLPPPRPWWPGDAVIPHPAPLQQSSGGVEESRTQLAVIPGAECCQRQPRATSSEGNQGGLLGGGSRHQCCGSGSDWWSLVVCPVEMGEFFRARHLATGVDP